VSDGELAGLIGVRRQTVNNWIAVGRHLGYSSRQAQDKKKYDELTQEDKDQKAEAEKAVDKKQAVIADYAKTNDIVHQLIDLALLQNGMLKGEALDKFLHRRFVFGFYIIPASLAESTAQLSALFPGYP